MMPGIAQLHVFDHPTDIFLPIFFLRELKTFGTNISDVLWPLARIFYPSWMSSGPWIVFESGSSEFCSLDPCAQIPMCDCHSVPDIRSWIFSLLFFVCLFVYMGFGFCFGLVFFVLDGWNFATVPFLGCRGLGNWKSWYDKITTVLEQNFRRTFCILDLKPICEPSGLSLSNWALKSPKL